MPKVVDREKRKAELAEALWCLAERDGFDAVSVRSVAREAGWSPGALRYYFVTQEGLLRFAMESLLERATSRIMRLLNESSSRHDPISLAVSVFEETLPFDQRRVAEIAAWRAISGAVRDYPGLRDVLDQEWDAGRLFCRMIVKLLWGLDYASDTATSFDEAIAQQQGLLFAFWDGLTYRSSSCPADFPPETMRQMLRLWFENVRALKPSPT